MVRNARHRIHDVPIEPGEEPKTMLAWQGGTRRAEGTLLEWFRPEGGRTCRGSGGRDAAGLPAGNQLAFEYLDLEPALDQRLVRRAHIPATPSPGSRPSRARHAWPLILRCSALEVTSRPEAQRRISDSWPAPRRDGSHQLRRTECGLSHRYFGWRVEMSEAHDDRRSVRKVVREGPPVAVQPKVDVPARLDVQQTPVVHGEGRADSNHAHAISPHDQIVRGRLDHLSAQPIPHDRPFAHDEVDPHAARCIADELRRLELDGHRRDEPQIGGEVPLRGCRTRGLPGASALVRRFLFRQTKLRRKSTRDMRRRNLSTAAAQDRRILDYLAGNKGRKSDRKILGLPSVVGPNLSPRH